MHNTDSDSVSSPLHLAARNGHIDIVRVLLQSGVDINWRTAAGSCLHEAVANEKPEVRFSKMVSFLVVSRVLGRFALSKRCFAELLACFFSLHNVGVTLVSRYQQ